MPNEMEEKEMTLAEIAKHECGCRCGQADCEFAADFFTPQGTPTAEFGADEDLTHGFSVTPTDYGYNRAAVEERAARMFEAGVDNELRDTQAEYAAASAQTLPDDRTDAEFAQDAEFAEDKVHMTGDMAVNYGPVTDNTPYHSTADYTMIDPDDNAFTTQGS